MLTVKTPEEGVDTSSAHCVLRGYVESRVVTCGPIALLNDFIISNLLL